jgi:SPP1 gp7 family putative phage head morphogenesis protein
MATEQNMLDALIQHQVYAYRASTAVVNELNAQFTTASNLFASKLRELLEELTDAEKDALKLGKYTTDTLKEVKSAFDEFSQVIYISLPETFAVSAVALATYEATYIAKLYGDEIALSGDKLFSKAKKAPIVGGRLYDEIWKSLATSTREKALYAVREGIQAGLTTAQIVNEIRGKRTKVGDKYEYVGGIVEQARHQIEASVRTVRNHVVQMSYEETFKALGFDYVKDVATLDGRTSATCRMRDGVVQKADDIKQRPPYHFNCRTVQVGCDKDGKIDGKRPFVADTRSVKNIPKDQREGIIGQVDANTTYPQWFARQSAEFQKEVLGKTKYALYKEGGFTLDKFVDPLNQPYTIAELRRLDQKTFKELGL